MPGAKRVAGRKVKQSRAYSNELNAQLLTARVTKNPTPSPHLLGHPPPLLFQAFCPQCFKGSVKWPYYRTILPYQTHPGCKELFSCTFYPLESASGSTNQRLSLWYTSSSLLWMFCIQKKEEKKCVILQVQFVNFKRTSWTCVYLSSVNVTVIFLL